jgi:hypothetical protein
MKRKRERKKRKPVSKLAEVRKASTGRREFARTEAQ